MQKCSLYTGKLYLQLAPWDEAEELPGKTKLLSFNGIAGGCARRSSESHCDSNEDESTFDQVHPDRTARGHSHHLNSDGNAAASAEEGERSDKTDQLYQQLQATRYRQHDVQRRQ